MTTARSDAAVARRAPAARRTTPILIVGASLLAVALAGWTLGRATSLDPTALATTFPRHPRESGDPGVAWAMSVHVALDARFRGHDGFCSELFSLT